MTCTRGTTNGNTRGSSTARRQRREWLVTTYRADRDMVRVEWTDGTVTTEDYVMRPEQLVEFRTVVTATPVPTCRCYRCGCLLTVDTVTVDRIKPGKFGGRYRTPRMDTREGVTNIRPACGRCNSETGGALSRST